MAFWVEVLEGGEMEVAGWAEVTEEEGMVVTGCIGRAVDKWVLGGAEAPPSSNIFLNSIFIIIIAVIKRLTLRRLTKGLHQYRFHR